MPSYVFRRLHDNEADAGLAIISEVTEWLASKGVRQWAAPLPREIYIERQEHDENYGLLLDGELAAVVSLMEFRPDYWEEYLPKTPYRWLATLASSRRFKGQRLGELAISEAEHYLAVEGVPAIYLDCVYGEGTLPEFYTWLGYQAVARKDLEFPWGTFDSMLMRKTLTGVPRG
ncbi:MAG: GNAT family N-acetyltransferase [Chloroflexi bacterium]|nr:GNAT family N-acetyltransferase [Chloroflexota bacterium]